MKGRERAVKGRERVVKGSRKGGERGWAEEQG